MGEIVTFAANGGTCDGYLATPAGGAGKGVVVFQEWWGVNHHIKDVCDRLASEGFRALAPDLYHGVTTTEPDEAGKLMMALNIEQAAKDARGAVSYLEELSGAPVGTVGFCMGGELSIFAACQAGPSVGACVEFYGVHPAVDLDLDNLSAPVLAFWPEHGDWTVPNRPSFDAALRERGKPYEAVEYPGTGHAFFNDQRPEAHNAAAAADAWRRTLAFFRQHL